MSNVKKVRFASLFVYQVEIEGGASEGDMKADADVVRLLGPGDIFGEISLVCSVPRNVTVRARTPVDIFMLSKASLDETLQHFPVSHKMVRARARARFGDMLDELERSSMSSKPSSPYSSPYSSSSAATPEAHEKTRMSIFM